MPSTSPYTISVFGSLRVAGPGGVASRFTTRRVAALLAYLALWPERVHPRDVLVEALWPDEDPELTRPRLRQTLALLKKDLAAGGIDADQLLEIGRLEVRLHTENVATDVGELRSLLRAIRLAEAETRVGASLLLDRAVALTDGALLPGFFDSWVVRERDVLEQALATARARIPALPPSSVEAPKPSAEVPTELLLRALPVPTTPLVGRRAECAALRRLLTPGAQVTLTAIGGMGKTRLALALAREEPACAFVPLADLTDAAQLPPALSAALGLPPAPLADDPLAVVVRRLQSGEDLLLVLDNAEHVLAPVAALVQRLQQDLPRLRILVTSRCVLGISGEQELVLAPLPIGSDALTLFVQRAQLARPQFSATPENLPVLTRLCAQLDGIPLALEMTAAWLAVLTPEQILRRLEQRFTLLVSRKSDTPTRQQSLYQVLESSVALLPTSVRALLGKLAVFAGGWTIEAAEAVCGDDSDPFALLEGLALLRERALIQPFSGREASRFRMLETVRVFSQELGQTEAVAMRHARYFAQLAKDERCHLSLSTETVSLNRLEDEHENFNLALDTLTLHDKDAALQLACDLDHFWVLRGHLREGRARLTALLALSGTTSTSRAWALRSLAMLSQYIGDYQNALEQFDAAVALFAEANNAEGVGWCQPSLASAAIEVGLYGRGEAILLALLDAPQHSVLGHVSNLTRLAKLNYCRGDYARCAALSREGWGLAEAEESGRSMVVLKLLLGMSLRELGALEEALHLLTESLQQTRTLQLTGSLGTALTEQATILLQFGRIADAQAALFEAVELCRALGNATAAAGALGLQARAFQETGALEEARQYAQEAVALLHTKPEPRMVAQVLEQVALLALAPEEGARLLGSAEVHRRRANYALRPTQEPPLVALRQRLHHVLGAARLAEQQERGHLLATEDALALAGQCLLLPLDKKLFR